LAKFQIPKIGGKKREEKEKKNPALVSWQKPPNFGGLLLVNIPS
jgi:hypothetical protein